MFNTSTGIPLMFNTSTGIPLMFNNCTGELMQLGGHYPTRGEAWTAGIQFHRCSDVARFTGLAIESDGTTLPLDEMQVRP